MRRMFLKHYLVAAVFFVLITLVRQYFSLSYYTFWLGAALGVLLPDVDHLIYIYFLQPQDLSSQRAQRIISTKDVFRTMDFLALTRTERRNLIFHNSMFQLMFLVFSYFVVSSTVSYFGKGLVLAFMLHLTIDQFVDMTQIGNIDLWFSRFNFILNKAQQTLYWVLVVVAIFIFGLVF